MKTQLEADFQWPSSAIKYFGRIKDKRMDVFFIPMLLREIIRGVCKTNLHISYVCSFNLYISIFIVDVSTSKVVKKIFKLLTLFMSNLHYLWILKFHKPFIFRILDIVAHRSFSLIQRTFLFTLLPIGRQHDKLISYLHSVTESVSILKSSM